MYEKKIKKLAKRGSRRTLMREARRQHRLKTMTFVALKEQRPTKVVMKPHRTLIDKVVQSRILVDLAKRTVALMQNNKLIQQKIIDLQKETSEFVASVLKNPISRRHYQEQIRRRDVIKQETLQQKYNENAYSSDS